MGRCRICGLNSRLISDRLGLCLRCIRERPDDALQESLKVHTESRNQFGLPSSPPKDPEGIACGICMNKCRIGLGKRGFCGLVANIDGRLTRFGGTPEKGILEWYYDPLPTNCVAWWFCAGCTGLGYPKYAYKAGAETGYSNLAVFYGACLPEYEKLFAIIDDRPMIIDIGKLVTRILRMDSADKLSFDPFILSKPCVSIKVAGLDDDCKIKYAPVSKVSRRWFDGQLIKITLETGRTLHVTPNHPMLVLQQNKFAVVNAEQLNIGDYVPIAKKLPNPTQKVDELDFIAELKKKGFDHKVMAHGAKRLLYGWKHLTKQLQEKKYFVETDVHPIRVKRTDSIPYEGHVYDLEVNDPSAPLATFMLASGVFTHNCSFDCLFCQNWHYRALSSKLQPVVSAESLAAKVHVTVSCICYFGGDPSPQMPHALRTSEIALEKAKQEGRILRICLAGPTSVMLGDGTCASMKELYQEVKNSKNMNVFAYNFTNRRLEKTEVIAAQKSKAKVLEIWVSGNKIRTTADHLFFVKRNESIELVEAKNLTVGDKLPVLSEQKIFLPFYYVMGVLRGDGYVTVRGKRIQARLYSSSKEFLEYIKKLIEKLGFSGRIHKFEDDSQLGSGVRFSLYIPAKLAWKYHKNLEGLPKGNGGLSSWLSGFFDAEGHVTIYIKGKHCASIGLTNSDKTLLRNVQNALLERFGIRSRLYADPRKNKVWQLYIRGALDVVKFSKYIGFRVHYKRRKLDYFCRAVLWKARSNLEAKVYSILDGTTPYQSIRKRINAHPDNIRKALKRLVEKNEVVRTDVGHYTRKIRFPSVKWKPVKMIKKKLGSCYVYDLTTKLHNFIANNVIVHNCWETNGYMNEVFADRAAKLSFESGGVVKFDIKTFNETLNQVLCGVSNKPTLDSFRRIGEKFFRDRLEPPVLTASTLLVPGYIDAEEVGQIANFLAGIDPKIPYTLLAFCPQYVMHDLPPTSRQLAHECFEAAKKAGLERIKIGNIHLLS